MKNTFTITTPLYYVNDVPHIGHAYTTIAADVLARWKRQKGEKVFFLTGTDEHGAKINDAAAKNNESPQDYVNRIAAEFKNLWTLLNISHDDFIQTTSPRHKKVVQFVFEKLKESGDITKGIYEDWYCIHDESYFSESELVDKKCPACGREVQKLKEETYFFHLSKYAEDLLRFYEENPDFLSPKHRANEIINFVKSGLRDLSVTRSRITWGVPVPSDPGHVVYVWFDALQNYISAPGYGVDPASPLSKEFQERWPADVHLVGKEIFRFHAVIWPAMLLALKLPIPKKVFAHGWWTVEGTKMSKSLSNVVDPRKMSDEYGVDAFRYFLLREVHFGSDGDFSEKSLLSRYNSELANNLGNLFQRTVTILMKHFDGLIPDSQNPPVLVMDTKELLQKVEAAYDKLAFGDILETMFQLMMKTNKYIDEQAPWTLGAEQKKELGVILTECLRVLKLLAFFLHPFMPGKMEEMWNKLGEGIPLHQAGPDVFKQLREGVLPPFLPGQRAQKGDPLFMRKGGRWK